MSETRKKRTLKGERLSSIPKKPHSNGLDFSTLLFLTPEDVTIINIDNKTATAKARAKTKKYFIIPCTLR